MFIILGIIDVMSSRLEKKRTLQMVSSFRYLWAQSQHMFLVWWWVSAHSMGHSYICDSTESYREIFALPPWHGLSQGRPYLFWGDLDIWKISNQIPVSVMESGFSGSPKEQMSLLFTNLPAGVSYLDLQNTLLVPQDKGRIRLKDKFTQKWKPELV